MVLNWLIRERGEWTALMNGLWASEPNCLLSKKEGGIQFIELRPSDIIWSAERDSAADGKGRKRFCAHFYFYLVINLRRRRRRRGVAGRETGAYLEMLQDVGRVGHAQPQHGSLGDLLHQPPQQSGQISADVSAVRSGVLTRQPDLTHSLWRGKVKWISTKKKKCTKIVIRVSYTNIWNFALKV